MEFKNINLNEKSQYISFMSPTLKNKKGHTRQMTKSIKSIPQEDLYQILKDTDELLENFKYYSSDYVLFLEAVKKFHSKSIEWVFEKTEIMSAYNQESIIRAIEKMIPTKDDKGQFIYPADILMGPSGSGKTTFLKQIIGSVNTDFPATMQANTTVGALIAVAANDAQQLIASVKLINKSALKNRLEQGYINVIKQVLRNSDDISDVLYNNITIFEDKKVKLEYILSKDDMNDENLLSLVKDESEDMWKSFLKNSTDLDFTVEKDFVQNYTVEFFTAFGEFVEERIDKSLVIDQLMNSIEERIQDIILSLYKYISDNNEIEGFIEVIDDSNVMQVNGSKAFKYPKMLTLEMKYSNGIQPDSKLRQKFFSALEYISSANENRKCKTLFPLVEHIRIKGNFKPLWIDSKSMEDYIIIDSEGIGHDITNQSVSMKMRESMSKCNLITVIQNGAEQVQTAFAETLKVLVYNGWIDKTLFCFNRMELFDSKAHKTDNSKLSFVHSNIKNAIKQIVQQEKDSKYQIVLNREDVYENLILSRCLYFEFLKEYIKNSDHFITNEDFERINSIDIDESIKNKLLESFSKQLSKDSLFNPVKNMELYLSEITKKRKNFTIEQISLKNFNPHYRADMFSATLNWINNEFVEEFLSHVTSAPWQTIKAFNVRIAGNWDNREWRYLQPESNFIQLANTAIMSYLLNPENIDEINECNGTEFISIIQQIVSNVITTYSSKYSINEIAKRTIYQDLLEDCWKPGVELEGKGSTSARENLINRKIKSKFWVDYKNGCPNFLYKEMVDLVMDNSYTRALNASYK